MASCSKDLRAFLPCLLFAACAAPRPATERAEPELPARLTALVESTAADWPTRIAASLPMREDEARALLAAVRRRPTAPGAPAAIAALGRCGRAIDDEVLAEFVADRGNLAIEAALALGDRKPTNVTEVLRAAVDDFAADATLRTAAACALARMGHGAEVAPFLAAVLLAGTPAGAAAGARHGLPVRPRWAMERYLVQRLLLREGASDLAQRLDPDASWPALEAICAEVVAWLNAR